MPLTPVTTTYLELNTPDENISVPRREEYELIQSVVPSPEFNRFLYATVGFQWYWYDRISWSCEQWIDWLGRDEVQTWVAYVEGTPAGYFELERKPDESVEIAFFGLLPQFIGKGLGGLLLTDAINRAWAFDARRVWLHTCTLDHSAALPNYLARGFNMFKKETEEKNLPDDLVPWPGYHGTIA